jgi:serine protease Do
MVRIEASGTFATPPGSRPEDVGRGSGFIVDPSGLIVTNSHVVTGADTVTVWVGSELTKQTADVLGVSECSDLAVIELKDRRDLPYLDWYERPIESGLPINAGEYPLQTNEAKVIPGAVERALGPTDAARLSVDDTMELDANIPAGSSGGPVVTSEGQVVAVTYPRDDVTKPPFAISRDEARPIVDLLQARRDVMSIGINGYAQKSDPNSEGAGIWVVAVKPGSEAAKSGILPGDIVTDLGGTSMAVDGTMAGYCEVLSKYQEGDPLPFSVYRADSRASFKGTLNGDPIEPDFSFAVALGHVTSSPKPALQTRSTKLRGNLSVDVPRDWESEDWTWEFEETRVGPGMRIASSIGAFRKGYKAPGTFIAASAKLADTPLAAVLDAYRPRFDERSKAKCTLTTGGTAFTRGGYAGIFDLWDGCGRTTSRFLTIAAKKTDGSHIVYIEFQAPEPADFAILDRMLVTLEFTP